MSARTDDQIVRSLHKIADDMHNIGKVLDALNTNLIIFVKAWHRVHPAIDVTTARKILNFSPNQVVRIAGTDSYGKVTVVGVDGIDLLPKIEVELNGSGEKVLFAPEQLETEGAQHGEKRP